jgi:hypothetical protein
MQNSLRNIPNPAPPVPLPAGASPIEHPGKPPEEVVHLKGKYAIRKDGYVCANNKHINGSTDFHFTDEIPESLRKTALEAVKRQERDVVATAAVAKKSDEFDRAVQAAVEKKLRDMGVNLLASKPSEAEAKEQTMFVIGNAEAPELIKWVFDTYGEKLDGRRSIDVLRVQAERIRDAASEKAE